MIGRPYEDPMMFSDDDSAIWNYLICMAKLAKKHIDDPAPTCYDGEYWKTVFKVVMDLIDDIEVNCWFIAFTDEEL